MSIVLTIFLCLVSLILAFFGVAQGIVLFVRLIYFTKPLSRDMVNNNIYTLSVHKQLVFVDCVSSLLTLLIASGITTGLILWGDIPCLITAVVGLVFGLIYSLIINQAAFRYTESNIVRFISRHRICMDEDRLKEYLDILGISLAGFN